MGYLKEGDPARYHLATNEEGLLIFVHKKAVPIASDFRANIVEAIAQRNNIPDLFLPPSADREWGFGHVLREQNSDNSDFISYVCELPKSFPPDGNPDRVFGVTSTLMLLFDALNLRNDTNSQTKQNLMVQMAVDRTRDAYGSPISIKLFSPITHWIGEHATQRIKERIGDSMFEAFSKMWNTDGEFGNQFRVGINHPNLIHLAVFGDACGLDPEYIDKKSLTYTLVPHNTDSPIQQLSLLAGVAKLEELATEKYFTQNPNQLNLGF